MAKEIGRISDVAIWLAGVPVSVANARSLITKLINDESPEAMAAAARIGHAILSVDTPSVELTAQERDAILTVIDDPALAELRAELRRHALAHSTERHSG